MLGALCAALATSNASAQRSQRGKLASLNSDAEDYNRGTTATLTGAGFRANELVTLQVQQADGTPSTGADHQPWTIRANARGDFVTTWHVCEDVECAGMLQRATAVSGSGLNGQVFFTSNNCGTGVVTSVTPVGGECSAFTPAVGNGPDNYEVEEGGTYVMTISGVTECSGDTITVFVQSSESGNFCFNATGGSGTYSGQFTMPNPACNTMPVNYKCGANAPCNNGGSFDASGPTSGCGGVHLRASNFDGNCNKTGTDTDCSAPGSCCLGDGTCVEISEEECTAIGGSYGGDGSLCIDADCEQPPGACCLPDGTCVQVTEEDCTVMNGVFHGDSTLCADVTCDQPPGACCLTDGTCVEVTEEECTELGGTFNGDFTECADVNCPPPPVGACCLMDDTCVEVTEDECTALGGLYNGDDSLCSEVNCIIPETVCFTLTFGLDDEGNPMAHGAKVDTEFNGGPNFPVTITGSVNPGGGNTAAILNSTTGPAAQDPDLLVGKANILILQTDANLSECPAASGIYCTHNDDEDGGTLTFVFNVPVTPSEIVLVDIDASDPTSTVVLLDSNGKTRTYSIPANWTGDLITNGPPGWKALDLTTTANQNGFASIATATEDAGFDETSVVQMDVNLGGSGGVDDLSWCQDL